MAGGRIVKRLLSAVVVLAITVAGCGRSGHVVHVADPHWPGEILLELNADAEGKQVVVKTRSGEELHGVHLHASTDSTVWYALDDPGQRIAVPTSQIALVHVTGNQPVDCAKEGLAVGAVLGALPAAIGTAREPEGAVIGIFVGLLCGGAGGALGALIGSGIEREVEGTVTYVLHESPPRASDRE
jgi:hypothetical protein